MPLGRLDAAKDEDEATQLILSHSSATTPLSRSISLAMSQFPHTRSLGERWHDRRDRLVIGRAELLGVPRGEIVYNAWMKGIDANWHLRQYWKRKVLSRGNFHPGEYGGRRNVKFGTTLSLIMRSLHWLFVTTTLS